MPPRGRAPGGGRRLLAAATALVCLAGLLAAGAVLVNELVRAPTVEEREAAADVEVAGRWQTWPSGKIFPERLTYVAETQGRETARRVGIAPGHSCTAAMLDGAEKALRTGGCRAALRATYLDQPQGVAITIGVLAFPDPKVAMDMADAMDGAGVPRLSLRALPVSRTAAARFTDAARQRQTVAAFGPYVVMSTAGFADGRPKEAVEQLRDEPFKMADELASDVATELARTLTPDCQQEQLWDC